MRAVSSRRRPRTRSPEERRDELLDAAQRCFRQHGVAATTIEQITTAARVAKGTFYLYFSSKEALLTALGDRFVQGLLADTRAAVDERSEADWRGKLVAWVRSGVAGYLNAMVLHDVAFHESGPHTRDGLVDNALIDHLAALLWAGARAGAWSLDDARCTAVFLFSGFHAVIDDAHRRAERVDRRRLARRLERLYLRAVGPPPG